MWGADDPDPRKPMLWADLEYEAEVTHPMGLPRRPDRVVPDVEWFATYQDLIALRKAHLSLFVDGDLTWLHVDDANGVLVYQRTLGDEVAIVGFNASEDPQEIVIEAADGTWQVAYAAGGRSGETINVSGDTLVSELGPLAARVWIRAGD
jgi:glycosidase